MIFSVNRTLKLVGRRTKMGTRPNGFLCLGSAQGALYKDGCQKNPCYRDKACPGIMTLEIMTLDICTKDSEILKHSPKLTKTHLY